MQTNHNPNGKRLIGTKFYTYYDNDTEATVYRLTRIKSTEKDTIYTLTNVNTGKIRRLTSEELIGEDSKFVMLNPDGILNFSIVSLKYGNVDKDVIVSLHRTSELKEFVPAVVCRMMIEDMFINQTVLHDKFKQFYIGMSLTPQTCPSNVSFENILQCKEVLWMASTSVYLDDTLEDLKKYIFPGINIKKFDKVLNTIKMSIEKETPSIKGACSSVYDLLYYNHFIKDFESAFGIVRIPGFDVDIFNRAIEIGDTDNIDRYCKVIGNITHEDVCALFPVRYNRDIRLSDIRRSYILVRPEKTYDEDPIDTGLYIVAYDVKDTTVYPNGSY